MSVIIIGVFFRQKEEDWMKIQVGDVLRIDNDDQIPVSHKLQTLFYPQLLVHVEAISFSISF